MAKPARLAAPKWACARMNSIAACTERGGAAPARAHALALYSVRRSSPSASSGLGGQSRGGSGLAARGGEDTGDLRAAAAADGRHHGGRVGRGGQRLGEDAAVVADGHCCTSMIG